MKLTQMQFDLKFDRPIDRNKHYISPGGYTLNNKTFDFNRFTGTIIDDNILQCVVNDFDEDYAIENGIKEVVPEDVTKNFSEFYIFTGEYDDPEINALSVDNLYFWFDNTRFNCPSETLKSANKCIANI